MIEEILSHLTFLVGADTTNPPRSITPDNRALCHVAEVLSSAGFVVEVNDHGAGCVNLLAIRGTPDLLLNCHLDTVPPDPNWSSDPHELRVDGENAIGLGACDVKGAASCLLAAAQATEGDAAILFTTDEEAGSGRCVRSFLETEGDRFHSIVVAEPTECTCVVSHRAVLSCEVEFTGQGGHSSLPRGSSRSALHDLVHWANSALSDPALAPHRLNIGRVSGGEKANMVASLATACFGARPEPGVDLLHVLETIRHHAPSESGASWKIHFLGESLTKTPNTDALVARLGMPESGEVDFWTEAALFSSHGLASVVFGPGEISQAHSADESVPIDQLARAASCYAALISEVDEPLLVP
ncbi:MAG: acetylornithine deacetylase [Phycisphaerales bacterium JB043]